MAIFIDTAVSENCWNQLDTYGELCVRCGCCAKDKRTRYESRLRCLNDWIDDRMNFDNWIPGEEEIQKKNISISLKSFKRMRRYYLRKLKEV